MPSSKSPVVPRDRAGGDSERARVRGLICSSDGDGDCTSSGCSCSARRRKSAGELARTVCDRCRNLAGDLSAVRGRRLGLVAWLWPKLVFNMMDRRISARLADESEGERGESPSIGGPEGLGDVAAIAAAAAASSCCWRCASESTGNEAERGLRSCPADDIEATDRGEPSEKVGGL